ncbi:MAG: DUF4468 domain-containing protein [Adhaeribacter sp.]
MYSRLLFSFSAFLLGLLLFPYGLQAQNFPREAGTGKIVFAEEVLVMDGPKTDLYRRARAWLLQNSHSSCVLLVDEEGNGLLIAHSFIGLQVGDQEASSPYKLWFTLKIEVENDRFWYRFYDLNMQQAGLRSAGARERPGQALEDFLPAPAPNGKQPPASPSSLTTQVHACIMELIEDLKKEMR